MSYNLNSLQVFPCRAWAIFRVTNITNSGGQQTLVAGGNVSSVYRDGLNPYFVVYFSTPLPSANFATVATSTPTTMANVTQNTHTMLGGRATGYTIVGIGVGGNTANSLPLSSQSDIVFSVAVFGGY